MRHGGLGRSSFGRNESLFRFVFDKEMEIFWVLLKREELSEMDHFLIFSLESYGVLQSFQTS